MDKRKTKRRDEIRGKSERSSKKHSLTSDTESFYAQGLIDKSWQKQSWRSIWGEDWTKVAAAFCRMDDGLSDQLDEETRELALSGLGNAIVPQVAQLIMEAIKENDERTTEHL